MLGLGLSIVKSNGVSRSDGQVPVNTVLPSISGNAVVGNILTGTNGTWTSDTGITGYLYQWLRNGVPIAGATNITYTTVSADIAQTITLSVIAIDLDGQSLPAISNSILCRDGLVPVNTVAPVISGTALVGQTLSTTNGTWTSDTGVTGFSYQWRRNGVAISGATNNTYVLVNADLDTDITCAVAATDLDGTSAFVSSNALYIFDTDYQAVVDRALVLGFNVPTLTQRIQQNKLVLSMKSSGVWAKSDAFYVFANNGGQNFATLNWKNPNANQCTLVNSPTFSTNLGFAGNGTSSFVDSNFNPSIHGSQYQQNNAGVSIGTFSTPTIGSYAVGTATINAGEVRIRMLSSLSDQMINGAVQSSNTGLNSNVIGNLHTDRLNATQIVSQVNSNLGNIVTNNSTGVPQNNIWLGRILSQYANMGIDYLIIRSSLSQAEKNTLNDIMDNYMNNL